MIIATMTFRLHAPCVYSLKEKRIIVNSIIAQLHNRFHVSAAEINEQDIHQIISRNPITEKGGTVIHEKENIETDLRGDAFGHIQAEIGRQNYCTADCG